MSLGIDRRRTSTSYQSLATAGRQLAECRRDYCVRTFMQRRVEAVAGTVADQSFALERGDEALFQVYVREHELSGLRAFCDRPVD
jgi:hypothetical protein